MEPQPIDFAPTRFTSRDLAVRKRLPALQDFWERELFNAEIEPIGDEPLHIDVTVRSLPDLALWSSSGSPLRLTRSPSMVTEDFESIGLVVPTNGFLAKQNGREAEIKAGEAGALAGADASIFTSPTFGSLQTLCVKRAALEPLVTDLDDAVARPLPAGSEAFVYLLSYVGFLKAFRGSLDQVAARSASRHLCDLLALAIGTGRDATELIAGRGLRAARLTSIKRYVARYAKDCGLSVGKVASHFNLTPRSIQRLFEADGTTFTKFLLGRRLAHARRMLIDPRYSQFSISTVAFTSGFSDMSYFNRCFRQRFGAAPGEVRYERT